MKHLVGFDISKTLKQAVFAAAFILSACTAHAADPWTKTDTALLVTAEALILTDMSQTLQFRRHDEEEKNCVLGARPHRDHTIAFISASMILTAAIAYVAPAGLREGFLSGVIFAEVWCVNHNRSYGYNIGWRF